jgi:hypothetical protein
MMAVFTGQEGLKLGGVSHLRDLEHVLHVIVEGLDDELQWHGVGCRAELAQVYPGIFHGCVGVGDLKEYQVVKFQDFCKVMLRK